MTFRPTARDISKHRQDGKFVIVVPKEKRIVPKEDEAEGDDDRASAYCAGAIASQ
jgi:hypothetical protein